MGIAARQTIKDFFDLEIMLDRWEKVFMLQFLAQSLEHLVPRIRAVVAGQLLESIGLRGCEEGPKLALGDVMLGVRDVRLFQHAIAVLADEEIRDMLLKGQLVGFVLSYAFSILTGTPHHGYRCPTG